MPKLISNPSHNKVEGISWPRQPMEILSSSVLSGGMVTNLDPRNLQDNQFSLIQNAKVIYERIQRRPGIVLYSPAKPDSDPVLAFLAFNQNDGSVRLIRFTENSIDIAGTTTWTNVTGDPLAGDQNDRFIGVVIGDRLFFSNNGANPIQEIDVNSNTYADAGNAPPYKYITGFADRVIGANLAGLNPDPTEIGWSGNLNYDEWDPLVDQSAGKALLVQSSSDRADFIHGVFGFADTMAIIRERSIWEATRQASASSPFNFQTRIPGIGSDAPYSVARLPTGLCFLDGRTRDIYFYNINGQIQSIGEPVREDILAAVTNASGVFGSYNQQFREYSIVVLSSTSTTARVWTFSFISNAWWYEEYLNVSYIADLDYAGSSVLIQDLPGNIEDLVGNIEDLSPSVISVTRFFGHTEGELSYVDWNADVDWNYNFGTILESKAFTIPTDNTYIAAIQLEYTPVLPGAFTVEFSVDGGKTWRVATTKTYTDENVGEYMLYTYKRLLNTRRYMFRVRTVSGSCAWREYSLWVNKAGDSRPGIR